LIAALATLLLLAEGAPAPDAPAAPDAPDAEALFREGLKAYDAKAYARAIDAFEAAHKLSPLPEILFDIAMAHRALGDCRRAADAFDGFIAAAPADDPLLTRARARRAELGGCGAADQRAVKASVAALDALSPALRPKTPGAAEPPILTVPTAAPAPPSRRGTWLRNTCFASIGGAAVLGAGGLVFGLQARAAEQEAEAAVVWDFPAMRADERGRTYGEVASILLISAGVTTAIATASCIATSRLGRF
jgi:tetratricopeptide (TPR) repeat protein